MTTLAVEMRDSIIELAGERRWHEYRSQWLARAARLAGISARMAKAFYYCEANDPAAVTVDRVRLAVARNRAAKARRLREQEASARAEYREAIELLQRISQRLAQIDPEFHSQDIGVLRDLTAETSGVDRAADPDVNAA